MNKTGLKILLGSIATAVFLLVLWFVGFIFAVGGGLIHLLLVLAMLIGGIGSFAGLLVMLLVKQPPQA